MATHSHTYVIVGGGVAADKAAHSIKEHDANADIAIYSASTFGPVYRPALSKDLWTGHDPDLDSQELGTAEVATVHTGVTVTGVDAATRTITLDNDETVAYTALLLATGADSVNPFDPVDNVVTFRSAEDYEALRAKVGEGTEVAIVGGGYIASELAAALTEVGATVTVYFPEEKLLQRLFPAKLLDIIEATYRDKGVTLVPGSFLSAVEEGPTLTFKNGESVSPDLVLLALGARLHTELAEDARLSMRDDAVEVDEYLRTSAEGIFAAGDIANYPDARLGRRHVEHVDNAERSGAVAGANMTGAEKVYDYTPIFWSDMFELGYEAIGEVNSRHAMTEFYNDDDSAAVVYYLDDSENVRGVLLWNTWGKTKEARELLGEPVPENLAEIIKPGG